MRIARHDHQARCRRRNYYRGLVTALMGLEARLALPGSTCARTPGRRVISSFLQAAFAGGVDIVQIRQKDMKPEAELAALGQLVRPPRPTKASSA